MPTRRRALDTSSGVSSRPLVLTLAGLAALGAAVLGAYVYDRLRPAPPTPAVAITAPVATSPTVETNRIPDRRPEFSLRDLAGKSHSISEWDGKDLIVNFWATWCAPCRREIPLLNTIQRDYAANGVEVVGIAVDFAEDVKKFVAQTPIAYPLLTGEQDGLDAAKGFGVEAMAFPFSAFIDAQGRIVTVHLGELHAPEAKAILEIVKRLDRGALTPVAASEEIRAALTALKAAKPSGAG